tara:strand:- start:255 stop:518 length:264 start_codon:yes stop_codon:yes gene_type:complete
MGNVIDFIEYKTRRNCEVLEEDYGWHEDQREGDNFSIAVVSTISNDEVGLVLVDKDSDTSMYFKGDDVAHLISGLVYAARYMSRDGR